MGQGGVYLQQGTRGRRKTKRGSGDTERGHEEEDDGSEGSSTVLGYSLPGILGSSVHKDHPLPLFSARSSLLRRRSPSLHLSSSFASFPDLSVPRLLRSSASPFLSFSVLQLLRSSSADSPADASAVTRAPLPLFPSPPRFFVFLTPLQSRVATFPTLFSFLRIPRVVPCDSSTLTLPLSPPFSFLHPSRHSCYLFVE